MKNNLDEPIAILGVNSSTNNKIYTVVVWNDSLSCDCPAGGIGTLCKHIRNIFKRNPNFLADYTKENEFELKQKLDNIVKNISKNVLISIEEIDKIKKNNVANKKELIAPLQKQIIRTSKHTISEAFKQAKILDNLEITTTNEELEALNIIKSILEKNNKTNEITFNDHKTFFNVLQNNKNFCRLYLNGKQKSIAFFENGIEFHTAINDIDDLHLHTDLILQNLAKK